MTTSSSVQRRLEMMTLPEKVGQVFIFTWLNEAQAHNDLRLHPGGYIRIYSDVSSVARQTRDIQQHSRIPLIIAADLERGIGGTLSGALEIVTCMALGATKNAGAAYDAGHMIGEEASSMGINMNYAPVLDVNSNPLNPVINTRSFGSDPNLVAKLGIAFARGLRDAGVAACGKHFPGHGNTNIDSHSMLGSIDSDRESLENMELLPFRAMIAAGVDAIMSAHLLVPALDAERLPATLSKRIMTDLLRHELGFQGVAVSDALDMGAVAENFPPEIAIPMAFNAGCDQLIMPQDNSFAIEVLTHAVMRGTVTEERLNEAVTRILTLKHSLGMLDAFPAPRPATASPLTYQPKNVKRALEIARQSITLVKDGGDLPLRSCQRICCISVNNGDDGRSRFLEPQSFCDYLATDSWNVKNFSLNTADNPTAVKTKQLMEAVSDADVIILACYINVRLSSGTVALSDEMLQYLKSVLAVGKPLILVSFGSPYIISQIPDASSYLCAYGATQPSQQAMAEVLKGVVPAHGTLPVALP